MDCDSTFPSLKLGRTQSISLGSWKPLTYSRNRKKPVTRICVVNGFLSLSRGRPGGRVILTPARRPSGRDRNPLTTNGFPTNNVVNGRERTTTLFVHLFLRVLEGRYRRFNINTSRTPAYGRLGKGNNLMLTTNGL